MNRHTISAKNCRIDIIDDIESDNILLNIFPNTYKDNEKIGDYNQVVIPRNAAKALANLLLGD